jgi:thioredoxin 1
LGLHGKDAKMNEIKLNIEVTQILSNHADVVDKVFENVGSEDEFDAFVGRHKLSIVSFTAPWCYSCTSLKPILDELAAEKGIPIALVDVDILPDLAQALDVQSIPTTIFFKDGVEVERQVGIHTAEELKNIFDSWALSDKE